MPIVGLRVCHTDLEGKERTSRESKSVFLERYQIKYPFCSIFQGPVECERTGSLEGTAMLCTQCLLTWYGLCREGLGKIGDIRHGVYYYEWLMNTITFSRLVSPALHPTLYWSHTELLRLVHSCPLSRARVCLEEGEMNS